MSYQTGRTNADDRGKEAAEVDRTISLGGVRIKEVLITLIVTFVMAVIFLNAIRPSIRAALADEAAKAAQQHLVTGETGVCLVDFVEKRVACRWNER